MAASITADARRKANLKVLSRLDPMILDIAGSATHVVLYEFGTASQTWEKTGVEGSLFVAKRSEAPRFKLVVLNRSSKDNLEVAVTGKFQMQVQDPYLIFQEVKSGTPKVHGIFFHDGAEREAVASLLKRVVASLGQIEELEQQQQQQRQQQPQQQQQQQQPGSSATTVATTGMQHLSVSDSNASANDTAAPRQNLVLDKKSLQLSLLSLIQDDRFLDLIHAQYLKVATARANKEKNGGGGGR